MTKPARSTELGICARFPYDNRDRAALGLRGLASLSVKHVRLALSVTDLENDAWLKWLLGRLAETHDVLVALDDQPILPETLELFLDHHGDRIKAVEICANGLPFPDDLMNNLKRKLLVLERHPLPAILSLGFWPRIGEATYLDVDKLENADAIGLRLSIGMNDRIDERVEDARRALRGVDPNKPLWITSIRHAGDCRDLVKPAMLLGDAMARDVDRIYWNGLIGDCSSNDTGSTTQDDLFDAAGQPGLLARLLAAGEGELDRVLSLSRRNQSPAVVGVRPVLVTGGAGFIGANLADRLASDGHHVLIYDALARPGVERNLHWLTRRHPGLVAFALGDLRDEAALSDAAASANAIFHLAGQVAVTTSMAQPLADFEVNARGTIALLDTLRRRNADAPLIFASTNKVYGDLADIALAREGDCYLPTRTDLRDNGIGEDRPLRFHTPYGCSKGAADQYVLDYAHSYGLRTAVLRMSCIYGERQLGTEDQGWVAHFLLKAIAGDPVTIYGDGRQVRDILHVGDAVAAYIAAWQNIDAIAGKAYNLGGGPQNAISLLQLVEHIEMLLGRPIEIDFSAWRNGDQRYFVADTSALHRDLSLASPLDWRSGVARLATYFGATMSSEMRLAEAAQ